MADIARPEDRQRLVADAFEYAREDIRGWIHCAGADVLTGRWAEASFAEKLEQLWMIDVQGTISLAREVCERWQGSTESLGSQHASMVFLGWDQALAGMDGDAGQMFGTVKGAVMSYSLALAQTMAPRIRVNCVAPGWIRTKWGEDASPYWSARATANALMARWGTPEDVAAAVVYLAGPEAAFVTGQILCVNGGWSRRYHP
jgi:3-oxoacyl-[acyl-carrier protein] reductase